MDNERLILALMSIKDVSLIDLTDQEKLIVLANLILLISSDYLPKNLQQDKDSLLNNGKLLAYELLKYNDDIGLNLAIKAHHIIQIANKLEDV